MQTLYLIDGMSIVFRAYHAMFRSGLTNPAGEPTGAIFGFVNIITSLLEREKPENIAVVFDTREPTFRHEMFPEYKANRAEFPEDLGPQLEKIKEFLDLVGIPRVEQPGFEADDIIGAIAKNASSRNEKVVCITNDKDYYQLVDDNIKIMKPAKGGEFEIVSYDEVKEKFGVTPDKVIDVQALIGDSVDNIPGVKGVGEKTAIPLIVEFGSLEGLYENIEKVEKKAAKKKLIENKEMAFLSKKLVTIATDMETELQPKQCIISTPNYEGLDKLFAEAGFNTIRKKWHNKAVEAGLDTIPEVDETPAAELKTIDNTPHEYIFADSFEKVDELITELSESSLISFDLETDSLDRLTCNIVGIALSSKAGKAWYIPTDEISENIEQKAENEQFSMFDNADNDEKSEIRKIRSAKSLPIQEVLEKIKPLLESDKFGKCGQNAKFDSFILRRYGVWVKPIIFDSMIAAYLINPEGKHDMDTLAEEHLNYKPVPISSLIGEKKSNQLSMGDLDPESISDYACEDADITLQLCQILKQKLENEGMLELAEKIEFPLIEVLTTMEINGIAIDENSLKELTDKIKIETVNLVKKIHEEAGTEFNVDSPKQLGHILFEKLMIPPIKKTKTGYSTDVQVLTKLADTWPIADYILEYRQLAKLKSTYTESLPKLVDKKTGRIHTSYNQAVTSTGRLSSTDPNLQNIPIRSELGKEVRKAFIPSNDDCTILAADYSQVELRIMAHICKDEHMVQGFREGLDVHSATSAVLFDLPIEEVDQDMRRIAKTVNFGIMYGLGAFGLSQRLNIPRKKSSEIIDNYFKKYPGIKKYIDITIENAKEKGYAETLCGRRRYFPEIKSKNANVRRGAERAAINMPIQGTASDMMKIAMIAVHKEMINRQFKSKMMLQVHDELVFEAKKEELEELKSMVIEKNAGSPEPWGCTSKS